MHALLEIYAGDIGENPEEWEVIPATTPETIPEKVPAPTKEPAPQKVPA